KLKLCASQEYLERRGVPKVPNDLNDHTLLYGRQSNVWYFNRDGDTEEVTIEQTNEPYDSVVHYYSVVSGVGVALFPEWVSAPSIASGSLVALLDDYDIHTESPAFCSAHIVTVSRNYAKKTRCFIEYLVNEMSTQYNLS
ncbi:MAG: LysR substrate-binding domain-containing protein, partial [Pseudomonadales bacterium]|nr:LysR substrate-binding domain-containing protein [Pseudomonadales bacterium]